MPLLTPIEGVEAIRGVLPRVKYLIVASNHGYKPVVEDMMLYGLHEWGAHMLCIHTNKQDEMPQRAFFTWVYGGRGKDLVPTLTMFMMARLMAAIKRENTVVLLLNKSMEMKLLLRRTGATIRTAPRWRNRMEAFFLRQVLPEGMLFKVQEAVPLVSTAAEYIEAAMRIIDIPSPRCELVARYLCRRRHQWLPLSAEATEHQCRVEVSMFLPQRVRKKDFCKRKSLRHADFKLWYYKRVSYPEALEALRAWMFQRRIHTHLGEETSDA